MCWQMGTLHFLGLLIIISYINNINAGSIPCGDTYHAKNGRNCYPCAAGYSIVSDCVRDGEQSRCKPCGQGEYMPTCDSAPQCKICDIFCPDSHHGVIENCTSLTNLKCQCIAGYYWKQHSNIPKDGRCVKHTQCKAGEAVFSKGSPFEDTKCVLCIEGRTFSDSKSSDVCLPCTKCNASLTLRKCSVTTDTICVNKTETSPDAKGDGLETWEIALIVSAIFVVIAVVVTVGVVIFIRRRRRNGSTETEMQKSKSNIGNGHVTIPYLSALSSSQNLTLNNVNLPNSSQSQSKQNHVNNQTDNTNVACNHSFTSQESASVETGLLGDHTNADTKTERETQSHTPDDEVNSLSKNSGSCKIALENETIVNGDIKPTREKRVSYQSNEGTPTVVHGISSMVQSEAAPGCSTSMDAGPVSQIHVQSVPPSNDNHIDNETTAAGANNECPSEAGPIILQPDCSDERTVNGPLVDPDSETINDRVFTSGSSFDTDVVVDHVCEEHDTVKERIHQLLEIWRQRKPKDIIKNIGQALDKCGHTVTKEKLYKVIKNQNGGVSGVNNLDVSIDFVQNVGEAHPHGELSTSAYISENTQTNAQQENNLKMMNLKEVRL